MKHFDYYKPHSLEEVWELKQKFPEALCIAGGTDLFVQIKKGDLRPSVLISLCSIPELSTLGFNGWINIGAVITINEIIQHPELRDKFPILVDAARNLGSIQIRNVATVGGNLCNCSPAADMATPLLVCEAVVRFQSSEGVRDVPLDKFFVGPGETCLAPGEILTNILVDPTGREVKSIFLKKGRVKMDLALASVAILLKMDGEICLSARIAAGSVAPVPVRLPKVEALLEGALLTS
jgi:carbon-monoxide dehydrogenase medium subunit